jgi:hypothetical protein
MGHSAFMSERQNEPTRAETASYELTVADVLAHACDRPRLSVPDDAVVLVAGCDINRAGLHWAVTAFDRRMTGHVVDYGRWQRNGEIWPENGNQNAIATGIYRALAGLADELSVRSYSRGVDRMPLSMLLIDASFESDTVHGFAGKARYPFRTVPIIGRAAHRYKYNTATIVGKPFEQCHIQRPNARICPYIMANADYWREVRQRAMIGDVGAPGSCSLYHPPTSGHHVGFAEHLVAERLANKYETSGGIRYEWSMKVGSKWDWGDALSYCYVAAAVSNLTTSG